MFRAVCTTWIITCLSTCEQKKELKAGPIIELCADDVIRYIAPLENIQGFFVPEVAQKEESKKEQWLAGAQAGLYSLPCDHCYLRWQSHLYIIKQVVDYTYLHSH